jgi:hypothetical protein
MTGPGPSTATPTAAAPPSDAHASTHPLINADFTHGTALAFLLTAVTALFAAFYAVTFGRSTT